MYEYEVVVINVDEEGNPDGTRIIYVRADDYDHLDQQLQWTLSVGENWKVRNRRLVDVEAR